MREKTARGIWKGPDRTRSAKQTEPGGGAGCGGGGGSKESTENQKWLSSIGIRSGGREAKPSPWKGEVLGEGTV